MLLGGPGGMAMVPPGQQRGGPSVNPSLSATGLDGNAAPVLSNLETIIAATVRAVTGQLSGLDGSADGSAMLRRNGNPPPLPGMDMTGAGGSGAFAMSRWSGPSVVGTDGLWSAETSRRPGVTGMPSADAVRSGLLASDNDPNTLYVGNVSCCDLIKVVLFLSSYAWPSACWCRFLISLVAILLSARECVLSLTSWVGSTFCTYGE